MIAVVTCMHNRPNISRIFCEGMERLKRETGLPIKVFAAISDEESKAVCVAYGVHWVWHENKPLGAKWNAVFNMAARHDPDHIFISGDDDLYSSDYLRAAIQSDYAVGLDSLAFLDSGSLRCAYFKYTIDKTVGAGRMVPRQVIQRLRRWNMLNPETQAWSEINFLQKQLVIRNGKKYLISPGGFYKAFAPEIDRGLDSSFEMSMAESCDRFYTLQIPGVHCIDVKSAVNIWKFDVFVERSEAISFEDATWFLSEKEKGMISELVFKQELNINK